MRESGKREEPDFGIERNEIERNITMVLKNAVDRKKYVDQMDSSLDGDEITLQLEVPQMKTQIEEVKMSQDFFFKMNSPNNFEKMKQNQQEFDNMMDKHYGAMHGN